MPQAFFQIGPDECAVDVLDDDRLAGPLTGFGLDGMTGAIGCEAGIGRLAGVSDMKDGHLPVAERVQQADDVLKGARVVALSTGSFPFIECNLDIDNNKACGSSWKLVHNMSLVSAKKMFIRGAFRSAAGVTLL